jgi:N-formylglutamate amidohydrolase
VEFKNSYTLEEIKDRLHQGALPFSGSTELGSAGFVFQRPAFYAGTAVHSGSRIRDDLQDALAVSQGDRYREEDPGTEQFIKDFPLQVIARYSRFEYDVNRSEELAIPIKPEMSWGLNIWKRPLTAEEKETSLAKYHEFHRLIDILSDYLVQNHDRVYIFDLHSYCYQREKRLPWHEDAKPAINLGTNSINWDLFRDDIDDFLGRLGRITDGERPLTVAENEVFKGGYLARRLSARYHDQMAVFAIEFKKIFMDEWSGEFYPDIFNTLVEQFSAVVQEYINERKIK